MSVGWKRQYEGEAMLEFLRILMMMQAEENSPELDVFSKRARLYVTMQAAREGQDAERGDVARDRISDCTECRQKNSGQCQRQIRPDGRCTYNTPDAKLTAIRKHFGEEGIRWIERAGELATTILEATNGTKN